MSRTSHNDLAKESIADGAIVITHIPDFLPDDLNPPNAIRKPMKVN